MKITAPIFFVVALAEASASANAQQHVSVPPMAPPPPPVMVSPMPVATTLRTTTPRPAVMIAVEVMGGAERLWAGQLRVAEYNSASFNSSVNEAPETCPADKSAQGRYAPNSGRSVQLSISRRNYDRSPSGEDSNFAISAGWTRPGVACEAGGTSTVSFNRTVALAPGGKAELKGDGGLVVRVSRGN